MEEQPEFVLPLPSATPATPAPIPLTNAPVQEGQPVTPAVFSPTFNQKNIQIHQHFGPQRVQRSRETSTPYPAGYDQHALPEGRLRNGHCLLEILNLFRLNFNLNYLNSDCEKVRVLSGCLRADNARCHFGLR